MRPLLIVVLACGSIWASSTVAVGQVPAEVGFRRVVQPLRIIRQDLKVRRKQYLDQIIADMRKVCSLTPDQVRILTIAAKGAVEYSLVPYELAQVAEEDNLVERLGGNIVWNRAVIADGPVIQIGGRQVHPQQLVDTSKVIDRTAAREPIWIKTVAKVLTEKQKRAYDEALEKRLREKKDQLTDHLLAKLAKVAPGWDEQRTRKAKQFFSETVDAVLHRDSLPEALAFSRSDALVQARQKIDPWIARSLNASQRNNWNREMLGVLLVNEGVMVGEILQQLPQIDVLAEPAQPVR